MNFSASTLLWYNDFEGGDRVRTVGYNAQYLKIEIAGAL